MKTFLLFTLSILWLVFSVFAADATPKTITASSSNGSLLWPTNFFSANSNSIWTVLGGGETGVLAIERGGTGTTNAAGLRGVIGLDAGDPGSMGTNWLTLTTAAEGRGVLGLDVAAPGALGTNLLTQATAGGVRGLVGLDAGEPGALGTNLLTQATAGGVRGLVGLDAADPGALGTNWLTLAAPLDGRSALGLGEWGTNTDFGLETASTSVRFATAADDTTIVGVRFTGNTNVSLLSMSTVGNGLLLTEADGTTPFVPANISPSGVMNYSTLTGLFVLSTNNYGVLPLLDDDPAEIATADHGRIYSKIGQKSRATLFCQTLSGSTKLAGEVVMVGPDAVATVDQIIVEDSVLGSDTTITGSGVVSTNLTAVVPDLAAVATYDEATTEAIVVKDARRGGTFIPTTESLTADGVTVIDNAVVGKKFKRVFSGDANVEWWGVYGDDAADDTEALQDAVDSVLSLYVPAGTYILTNAVQLRDGSKITGAGPESTIVDASTAVISGDDGVFNAEADMAAFYTTNLLATISVGATNFTIPAPWELPIGTLVLVKDRSASAIPSVDSYHKSWMGYVYATNATDVMLTSPSRNEFIPNEETRIYVCDWPSVTLRDFAVIASTNSPACISLEGAHKSVVENISTVGGLSRAMLIHGYDVTLRNCHIEHFCVRDSGAESIGEQLTLAIGGEKVLMENNRVFGDGQIMTTGGGTVVQQTRDLKVLNNWIECSGTYPTGWDPAVGQSVLGVHPDADDYEIAGNTVVRGYIDARGRNGNIHDNTIILGQGMRAASLSSSPSADIRFVNNVVRVLATGNYATYRHIVYLRHDDDGDGPSVWDLRGNKFVFETSTNTLPTYIFQYTAETNTYELNRTVRVNVSGNEVTCKTQPSGDIALVGYFITGADMASPHTNTTFTITHNTFTVPSPGTWTGYFYPWRDHYESEASWTYGFSVLDIENNNFSVARLKQPYKAQHVVIRNNRWGIGGQYALDDIAACAAYHTYRTLTVEGNLFDQPTGVSSGAHRPINLWGDSSGVTIATFANNKVSHNHSTSGYALQVGASGSTARTPLRAKVVDNHFVGLASTSYAARVYQTTNFEQHGNTISGTYGGVIGGTEGTEIVKNIVLSYGQSASENVVATGTAIPTYGAWKVGDILLNKSVTGTTPRAWICTGAGSPGTWRLFSPYTSRLTTPITSLTGEMLNEHAAECDTNNWTIANHTYITAVTTPTTNFVYKEVAPAVLTANSFQTTVGDSTAGNRVYDVSITLTAAAILTAASGPLPTVTVSLGGTQIGTIAHGASTFTATARAGAASTIYLLIATSTPGGVNATNEIGFDRVSVKPWASGDMMHSHSYIAGTFTTSGTTAPYFEFSASGSNAATADVKTNVLALATATVTDAPEIIGQIVTGDNGGNWVVRGKVFATASDDYALELTYIDPTVTTNIVTAATDLARWAWANAGYIYFGVRDDSADAGVTINTSSVEFKP